MIESPVRGLVSHYIGGGWGDESPSPQTKPVRVIRGADFPTVSTGSLMGVPHRFEAVSKIPNRALRPGDIVLEISGGTKERPTGRTVYVSEALLAQSDLPVIPASFCRLVRPDPGEVDPRYLYYWLQNMYAEGRTWGYQVQSTGLANFQMETFLDTEIVRVPPLREQRRISNVLGALDDLIAHDWRLLSDLRSLSRATFENAAAEGEDLPFGHVADLVRDGVSAAGLSAGTRYLGLEHFEVDGGGIGGVGDAGLVGSNKTRFQAGDVLYGKLRPYFRKHDRPGFSGVCSTEIWVLRPSEGFGAATVDALVSRPEFTDFAMSGSGGTRMPRADWKHVSTMPVSVPPVGSRARIEAILDEFWRARVALADEINGLTRARDELLPLLMSGRVRTKDVDGLVA